jgi:hypothetical protein
VRRIHRPVRHLVRPRVGDDPPLVHPRRARRRARAGSARLRRGRSPGRPLSLVLPEAWMDDARRPSSCAVGRRRRSGPRRPFRPHSSSDAPSAAASCATRAAGRIGSFEHRGHRRDDLLFAGLAPRLRREPGPPGHGSSAPAVGSSGSVFLVPTNATRSPSPKPCAFRQTEIDALSSIESTPVKIRRSTAILRGVPAHDCGVGAR